MRLPGFWHTPSHFGMPKLRFINLLSMPIFSWAFNIETDGEIWDYLGNGTYVYDLEGKYLSYGQAM